MGTYTGTELELTFKVTTDDEEIQAIEVVCTLMQRLRQDQRERVLTWASSRFRGQEVHKD